MAEKHKKISRTEILRAAMYAAVLIAINAYLCRELFSIETAYTGSMHGFWIALAKYADGAWFHPRWWRYWDAGIPFEFTYSPLLPALMAAWSAVSGISLALAFDRITAIAYCAVPLTLFIAAWLMTRAAGASFAAALIYTLTAPAQLLTPDAPFSFSAVWDPRRLYVAAVWDDTPHLIALAFLPLTILFLSLAIQTRKLVYCAAAVLCISTATMASAFGPTEAALAAISLLFVLDRANFGRNFILIAAIGAFSYAMSSAFLPPSVIAAMRAGSVAPAHGETGFTVGSVTAIAIIALGWTILWRFLPRWTSDWRLQFFALFAYLTSSIPILWAYTHRQFLPQPVRYKMEMDLALALLLPFLFRPWFARMPLPVRRAAICVLITLAAEQMIYQRHIAKDWLRPADPHQTVEAHASTWIEKNLPGVRVMMGGSLGQWADAFTAIPQFGGSSWSMAYNGVQQRALADAYNSGATAEEDARTSLAWLKAYGVGAVAVPGKDSAEFWKPFAHPKKFDGVLPVVWRENDVTIYKIPRASISLAHVIPESALVTKVPASVDAIAPFVTALDQETTIAEARWDGDNRLLIHASTTPGEIVSIQVSHHRGWHATVNGRAAELHRDGLGLMWLRPQTSGVQDIRLDYDAGFGLRFWRYLTYTALLILLFVFPLRRIIMK